jgi:hypothetical protein
MCGCESEMSDKVKGHGSLLSKTKPHTQIFWSVVIPSQDHWRALTSFNILQLPILVQCLRHQPHFRILVSCAKVIWGHDDSSVYKTSPDRLYNNWQHSSFSTSIHIHLHHCTNISIYIYPHPYHPWMSIWIIILCRFFITTPGSACPADTRGSGRNTTWPRWNDDYCHSIWVNSFQAVM